MCFVRIIFCITVPLWCFYQNNHQPYRQIHISASQGHGQNRLTDWSMLANDSSTQKACDLCLSLLLSSLLLFYLHHFHIPRYLSHFHFARLSSRLCTPGTTNRTATNSTPLPLKLTLMYEKNAEGRE